MGAAAAFASTFAAGRRRHERLQVHPEASSAQFSARTGAKPFWRVEKILAPHFRQILIT